MPPKLRIGCVPYLNAKPLVEYFDTEAPNEVELIFEVPIKLADMLLNNEVDVALVSIFESFVHPQWLIIPDCSISSEGLVRSVRLFSKKPFDQIKSVALDTSSLTSTALTRILLDEVYGVKPEFTNMPPDIAKMLDTCDAGLIIGDLRDFDLPGVQILDLGDCWHKRTGRPFCFAAWLAQPNIDFDHVAELLSNARRWGQARIEPIAEKWHAHFGLPKETAYDYLANVIKFDLDPNKQDAIRVFRAKCEQHGLVEPIHNSRGPIE
ncbi:MAG: menaquinone biosynthesis protein [Chthonomonadales bacterium]